VGLVVVDFEGTPHALLMERCALAESPLVRISWLRPDHRLPERLVALDATTAVAIPLTIRGATSRDRFTRRVMDAIRDLRARGIEVFVAQPRRRPSPLAEAGVAVRAAETVIDAIAQGGASGACVRAAVRHVAAYDPEPQPEAPVWLSPST